jgi:S-adenosylmethionine:tRNA ribosyltransferase-isomerase
MTDVSTNLEIPTGQGADRPPEERDVPRDGVRLLVSTVHEDTTYRFPDLVELLRPGDLLVVNESATVPASLPARSGLGEFLVNLSTPYGPGLWVGEPRWGPGKPGPLPLGVPSTLVVGGVTCRLVAGFPGIPRLVFLQSEGDLWNAMREVGQPIRYGYAARAFSLDAYQTVFARVPGSAEMPSAARPFTSRLVDLLLSRGVAIAPIVLHTGVSSLDTTDFPLGAIPVFPEPFEVPGSTVRSILETRARGGRVVAVGTTVVRALESATDSCGLRPTHGFTRLYLSPERPVRSVDGLLTGFHEARSTHLALLSAFVGGSRLQRAYEVAVREGFLWHEFGDSHLVWADQVP